MTDTDRRRATAAQWVALLTLAWFLTVPVLLLFGISHSLSFGSEPNPGRRTGALFFVAAAALGVLLPMLATVQAYRGERPVLGTVYALLTMLLLVPAGLTVHSATGTTVPDPPVPPGPPGHCMEHSGGDSECPGG